MVNFLIGPKTKHSYSMNSNSALFGTNDFHVLFKGSIDKEIRASLLNIIDSIMSKVLFHLVLTS